MHRVLLKLGAAVGVVLIYVWDDLFFAAPIVGAVKLVGPGLTFFGGIVIYGSFSYILALWAVRAYERYKVEGEESRLAKWLEKESDSSHGRLASRLLTAGKAIGFVISSWLAGAIITTFLVRYAGRREGIHILAAASCAIFAIGFVGQYAGLASILF